MFSSQKSRESTKKTKEIKIDLNNEKQKTNKQKNRKQRNTRFCETKLDKLLQVCSRKKVRYERGCAPAGDCGQGLPTNGGSTGSPAAPGQPPLCRGATVHPQSTTTADRRPGKRTAAEQEEQLAEATTTEAPEGTGTETRLCCSAGHTKESPHLFNCLNKQILLPGEYPLD